MTASTSTRAPAAASSNARAMEFRVAGAPEYDTSSPGRWIISHVLRYKVLAGGFLAATLLVAV
ncbi:MAG: hypothetical protein ACE5EL_07510, partial [Anaerolineae bacterium]